MSVFNHPYRLRISQLPSTQWANDVPGVMRFVELESLGPDETDDVGSPIVSLSELRYSLKPSAVRVKFNMLGFRYVGCRIRADALGPLAREAYGVERDGVQNVLVVLKQAVRSESCVLVPYRLVPQWVKLMELRGGCHVKGYKLKDKGDDEIVDAIKQPDENKWIWFNKDL